MANTSKEAPITRAWWKEELQAAGTLYKELPVTPGSRGVQEIRKVDGVVVLNDTPGKCVEARGFQDLNGKDIVVIQTKATKLNPQVFGQALLSPRLIQQSWKPRSTRSMLLCIADQPELSSVITQAFPEVELRIRPGEKSSFYWPRIKGAAECYARSKDTAFRGPESIVAGLKIDGAIITGPEASPDVPLIQIAAGRHITTLHSEMSSRGVPARIGMWMGGEVVMTQRILLDAGASSVHSVVLCGHRDRAIEKALGDYANFDIALVNRTNGGAVSLRTR